MKCPLNGLCECDPDCACRLHVFGRNWSGGDVHKGYVCAFAANSDNTYEGKSRVKAMVDTCE